MANINSIKLPDGTTYDINAKTVAGKTVQTDVPANAVFTDTTYSPFTGTDGTEAGVAGLVPAPSISDANKVLKSDGTWMSIAGGVTVEDITQAQYNALTSSQKRNGSIYMTRDGGYDFISYNNGDIIVRVNTNTQETLWFFRGWNKTMTGDVDIPEELAEYAPSVTTPVFSARYPTSSSEQDGWIGFYMGRIRAWNQELGGTIAGIMYGVVNIANGANQTNPYTQPTDGLTLEPNRIYHMDTMYSEVKDTNDAVTQTASDSNDAEYELLFSETADNNTHTEGVRKTQYAKVNPNKKAFTLGTRLANSTVGNYSVAEGDGTTASGAYSHAEGCDTIASNHYSHAEGNSTIASGTCSHTEGNSTTASGGSSHAEGDGTIASGTCSHAEGIGTIAQRKSQHVFGKYNIADTQGTTTTYGEYVEIVGNGSYNPTRPEGEELICSNARTLDWDGNETLAGNLQLAGTSSDVSLTGSGNTWDGTNSSLKTAIGEILSSLTDLIKVEEYTYTYSINAESALNISKTDFGITTPTGYTPLAIYRFNSGFQGIYARNVNIDPTATTVMSVYNTTSITRNNNKAYIVIAYIKSDFVAISS